MKVLLFSAIAALLSLVLADDQVKSQDADKDVYVVVKKFGGHNGAARYNDMQEDDDYYHPIKNYNHAQASYYGNDGPYEWNNNNPYKVHEDDDDDVYRHVNKVSKKKRRNNEEEDGNDDDDDDDEEGNAGENTTKTSAERPTSTRTTSAKGTTTSAKGTTTTKSTMTPVPVKTPYY